MSFFHFSPLFIFSRGNCGQVFGVREWWTCEWTNIISCLILRNNYALKPTLKLRQLVGILKSPNDFHPPSLSSSPPLPTTPPAIELLLKMAENEEVIEFALSIDGLKSACSLFQRGSEHASYAALRILYFSHGIFSQLDPVVVQAVAFLSSSIMTLPKFAQSCCQTFLISNIPVEFHLDSCLRLLEYSDADYMPQDTYFLPLCNLHS